MCITIHEATMSECICAVDTQAKLAHGGASCLITMSSLVDDPQALHEGLLEWTSERRPSLGFEGVHVDDCHKVATALCEKGAYYNKDEVLVVAGDDERTLQVLQALQGLELVCTSRTLSGCEGWQFTEAGMQRLRFKNTLIESTRALLPRDRLSLTEIKKCFPPSC